MEPKGESDLRKKQRAQQESPRNSPGLQELLLTKDAMTHNSPSETRMLEIADNFQRQYSHLFPERRPLLLSLENEHGVKKFVSTTLRPTAAEHPELYHWRGCAAFVADFLALKPLESPVDLPRQLFSPSTVLQNQSATCWEAATLLCSMLIGAHYEAYCVSGYASREVCECDQSQQECPPLDNVRKDVRSEQNKYTVKPNKKLHSRFLLQQEMKEKEKETALLLEQQKKDEERPADNLRGLRLHCWVLVKSGSRDIEESFFIDPLSGNCYTTNDGNFLGMESVWDNYNYYVNMQDCCNHCSGNEFDLEDVNLWEPVLVGATSKKQLIDQILKRKENRFLGKVIRKQKVELGPRAFQMPQPWSRCISISKKDLEHRYPGGKKVTHYRRAKLEKFGLLLQPDGLITRLTTYRDWTCTDVELVKEWYQGRNDHLEHREFNQVLQVTSEYFQRGRRFHLLRHRYSESEHEMEFNSRARADGLLRRVLSKSEMTDTFEGRFDYLHFRQVTFLIPDGLSDVQHIPLQKVEERFHRNPALPLREDVARQTFLLAEGQIQLTYQMEDFTAIPSKRLFVKPLPATESWRAEDFTSTNVQTFQVDPSVQPLSRLALYWILRDLLKDENSAAERAQESWNEIRDIRLSREEEEKNLQLIFSSGTHAGDALGHKQQKQTLKAAEQAECQLDRVDNYLVPYLANLDFPETLTSTDYDSIVANCLQEFTERRTTVSDLIKEHQKKLLQELRETQRSYQQNQELLSKEAVEEYRDYCSEKSLIMKVVQDRLDRYLKGTPGKVKAFHQQLLNSPQLRPQTLGCPLRPSAETSDPRLPPQTLS